MQVLGGNDGKVGAVMVAEDVIKDGCSCGDVGCKGNARWAGHLTFVGLLGVDF